MLIQNILRACGEKVYDSAMWVNITSAKLYYIALFFTQKARFDGNFVNIFFFVYCEEYFINLFVSLSLENMARVGQLTSIDRFYTYDHFA